jgi:uncharacterized GH25 family protein
MNIKIVIFSLIMLLGFIAQAHEFWLSSEKFTYQVGEELKINFNVGKHFIGKPWDLKLDKVEQLTLHHLNNVTDLRPTIKEGTKENLALILKEEGTHIISMQSASSIQEVDANIFNEYLKENGLDEVIQYREQNGLTSKPVKENYTSFTKLMVQVGDKRDETYKKSIGFPLEIFIEKNPYNIKVGELIKFKVLYEGKPLFGAKIMVWNRYDNRTTMQPVYTLQNGVIEARISSKGPWMVSVVKMVPSRDKSADWQSYWGSLVFGVE